MRIGTKISLSHILIVVLSLALLAALLALRVEALMMNNLKKELRDKASAIAAVIKAGSYKDSDLQLLARSLSLRFGSNITLIDSSGKVWADSEQDTASINDLIDQPEVRTAISGNFGEDLRTSRKATTEFSTSRLQLSA